MASGGDPDSDERWLLTRKTWRYMADAGRKLIPEGRAGEAGPSLQQVERNFQEVCRKEKSFLLWRRSKKHRRRDTGSSIPATPTTVGHASLNTSDEEITVIENRACERGSSPCQPLFGLAGYGASAEAYQRGSAYPRSLSAGSRMVPVSYDLEGAEDLKERLRYRKEEDDRLVTIGTIEEMVEDDGESRIVRHMGVQTDNRLVDLFTPLPPLETDSGKGTEAEVSTPETPLSPVSMVDSRADSFRSPTSITSGVSSIGMCVSPTSALRKDSMVQANILPLVELPKDDASTQSSIPEESAAPDRFGDKLSRYMKMARRDSKGKDKKDLFKTVNYDKTLRNIKSKRINPDTLEDMSEDVKPLDIDEILREARLESPPWPASPPPAQSQAKPGAKKKKRRGIQVGEPLPQYILDSLRHAFSSFRPIRKMSKTESDVSASADEKSIDPLSPRYSIAVSDGAGTRDVTLSDVDSPPGAMSPRSPRSSIRSSADIRADSPDGVPHFGHPRTVLSSSPSPPTVIPHHRPSSQEFSSPHGSPSKPGFFARRLSSVKAPQAIQQLQQSLQLSQQRQHRQSYHGQTPVQLDQSKAASDSKRGFLSSVMRTGKPSSNSRVVAKKLWKSRSKSQSRTSLSSACLWSPQASCQWANIQSRLVTISSCQLSQLSGLEAALLRQLALDRLADLNLGCPVRIPKDVSSSSGRKQKRRPYLLRKRPLTTSLFDASKRDDPEADKSTGLVFGIALTKCLEHDRRLYGGSGTPLGDGAASSFRSRQSRANSHSSFSSLTDTPHDKTGSCESLDLGEKRASVEESSLSLSSDLDSEMSLLVRPAQIPRMVSTCIRHIENHGLNTVGIFRVSSSKKRSRQLREEFDTGADVKLSEECCPHDAATLLKEFFRDLPHPLLPHELYQPFLASQRIRNRREQFEIFQYLIWLLPAPNRDTLYTLLCFLKLVSENSSDRRTQGGDWLTGNRMDSSNLATLFAPNILHSWANMTGEQAEQTAERIDVINVFRSLIDHNKDLFEVQAEQLHSSYQMMMDQYPDALDILLRRRLQSNTYDVDADGDTSSCVMDNSQSGPGSTASTPVLKQRSADNVNDVRTPGSVSHTPRSPLSAKPEQPERTRRVRRREAREALDRGRDRVHQGETSRGSGGDAAGGGRSGSWFHRRVRSSSTSKRPSADEDRSSTSASRWFRRREKSGSQGSDSSTDAGRRASLQAVDRPLLMKNAARQRSTSDKTVLHPASAHLQQKDLQMRRRRLSSPDFDVDDVITASLRIAVPGAAVGAGLQSSLSSADLPLSDEDLYSPFQHHRDLDDVFFPKTPEVPVDARQPLSRSCSADSSAAGEPITCSLSIQPSSRVEGKMEYKISASSVLRSFGHSAVSTYADDTVSDHSAKMTTASSSTGRHPFGRGARDQALSLTSPPPPDAHRDTSPNVSRDKTANPPAHAPLIRSRTAPGGAAEAAPSTRSVGRHRKSATAELEDRAAGKPRRRETDPPPRRTRRRPGRAAPSSSVEGPADGNGTSSHVWKRHEIIASDGHTRI